MSGGTKRITDLTEQSEITSDAYIMTDNATSGAHKYNLKTLSDQVAETAEGLANLAEHTVEPDDLGLEQDPETNIVYPTYKGVRSENGIYIAGGGDGGGGGNNAVLAVTNETGWLSGTVSFGASCVLSIDWSSIEDEMPTGDGSLAVTVNNTPKLTRTVAQGSVTVDVGEWLVVGSNKVKVKVADVYDNSRTITFTIAAVELSVSSSFDTSGTFAAGSPIEYTYTPVGAVEKTVYFVVDGEIDDIATVTTSGRQQTQALSALAHGAHTLLVYFTATVDGNLVRSNELYYSLVVVSPESNVPIVSTPFRADTAMKYQTLSIPYTVYTPNSLTSQVVLSANGEQVASLTVDRTERTWSYRCDEMGELTLTIATGTISKTLELTVTESDVDVQAETANLSLYLTSQGRSNDEAHPDAWEDADNHVSCTLSDFNFTSDGWVVDSDGFTALRVANDARVTIPYQPFATDFRPTGKTLEFEFATHDVYDYDATVITCWSGDRGFKLTAQRALLASEQSSISTQYKEDEHVRVSFVAEKRNENRLLMLYINGIMSGVVQYPANDNFQQQVPVNITIGSSDCAIDLYNIRVYDNDLTRHQILDNWIADTQDVTLMLERYYHNDVYDEYGKVTIENLPPDLPYLVISAPQLPQYKGDKKTVSGYYVDPVNPAKSYSFDGASIDVQGTSSQYYPRKNYKVKYSGGFHMTQSGTDESRYALRADSVPTKTFTYKADVASSEGANNVELARLYNDAVPYRTPPQEADPRVRQGIDGLPIVVFWDNGSSVTFVGKYNANNDKGTEEVFGFAEGDESWEILNNNSLRTVFKSADFTGSDWQNDFEGRYPDGNEDPQNLAALSAWLVSTDREQATGDALEESYVDVDGETHTVDNAAYRLAKFKTEAPDHFEMQSAYFYYLFTELFLMVDSRAKNAFPSFLGGDKWCWLPYDFDSAIGINNEGELVFDYSLEDTDTVDGANVYNGQNSVMWCNLRDAFPGEIASMYQSLRSTGAISYQLVEQAFETHQAKWPEAIFNEDAWFKYIDPLVDNGEGAYLMMAQGSKAEQRKWWLYNRFRYIDSKYVAGDALTDIINLRAYAKGPITVTPYADIYPTVRWESYTSIDRGHRGTPTVLPCPMSGDITDANVIVFSASQLASVGDLSPLKVGLANFANATRLQSIKVGDDTAGYTNPNLTTLVVGNNVLLGTVDARNCTSLSGTVDLSGATNVEHVYLDGTAVTSVSLPVGGILKTLSLPDTITNLTVQSQMAITSFDMDGNDYSSITTLRVENSSSAIPVLDILDQMTANSRVRIIGFVALAESTDDVEDFFDYLDTMQGLDEAGNNLDHAVVSGTITGLGTITGAWLAEMNSRYPDVTIQYEHISSALSYYSWDGLTLLHTETVADGGNGTWDGTPTRTSTAQYSYAFAGWSRYTDQSTADPTATQGVGADRSVYAAYTATTRTYTVTWKNADNTTLETDQNVPYGTTPTYNGQTPTYQGETSTGWNPAVGPITGDTTYTAIYIPTYQVRFYSGTSSSSAGTLLQTTRVQEGSAAVYSGSTPTNPDGQSYWEFTGWDKALTNIREATDFYAKYRDTRSVVIQYVEGTMTDYFSDTATTIFNRAFARDNIVTVTTSATDISDLSLSGSHGLETVVLTSREQVTIGTSAFNGSTKLASIVIYSPTMAALSGNGYWFKDTQIIKKFGAVFVPDALVNTYKADANWNQVIILPLSEYPTTDYSVIRDSWSDIIAATSNGTANKYAIGDTKLLDVGTEGKVYVQVAKVDSTGLTFVTKDMLKTMKRMNPGNSSGTQGTGGNGGWEHSEMRTYLNEMVFALFPAELQAAIQTETKYSNNYNGGRIVDGCVTQDKLWLLSHQEVFGETTYETQGEHYGVLFPDESSRIKLDQSGSANIWWLRSVHSNFAFRDVASDGSAFAATASENYGVVFGFTIGHHPTEEERWTALKTAISNGTLKQKYAIGDTLPLNLGTEGKVEMQIAAFDEGSSHVSFVSKGTLATKHRMNATGTTTGGWTNSEMRTYLTGTILPLVPSYVSSAIVSVTKYSYDMASGANTETTDSLWIPSAQEVGTTSGNRETSGVVYSGLFSNDASRVKYNQSGSAYNWWLRSANTANNFRDVGDRGSVGDDIASYACCVVLGFCL